MTGRPLHVINIGLDAFVCTQEFIRLFTEFSGCHLVLMILDAKKIIFPFLEISRRRSPEIIRVLEG